MKTPTLLRMQLPSTPPLRLTRPRPGCSLLLAIGLASLGLAPETVAFSNRVGMIPNGQVFSCNTCHLSGGGSPSNPFGLAVGTITQGNPATVFWSAALAAQDSDGDGFTNGEELGDPDGDGTPLPGVQVTNPGNANSFPTVPPIELAGLELLPGGTTLTLSWTGGRGPFLVQKKSGSLGAQDWEDALPATSERSVTLEFDGGAGFFRVVSQAN